MRRWVTALVVLLGMAGTGLATAAGASAATTCLVVDTNSDQSYASLQDAVTAAAPGDTLFVKGTCTGTTEIGKNLTISGQSQSGTKTATLNGGGALGSALAGVLTIDRGVTVTLNTLVITNGNTGGGGGIENFGTVTLNNSTITGNTALNGGGIETFGTVTLNNSTITGNTGFIGGGIDNEGAVILNGGSTITGNSAEFGGGICTTDAPEILLIGAVAGSGGNVFNNHPDDLLTAPIC